MIGQTLGAYQIERELGRGGMGAVYAAVHTKLGRRAAVKVLLAELSREPSLVERFFNEARAATMIRHPSIVDVYDFGTAPDGAAFIVMELMDGQSLATRMEHVRRMPLTTALTIARQIATALAAAHGAGIVHRDLKPDNVFLVRDPEVAGGERVKLLDFGIAKLFSDGAASRTSTGMLLGTPLYMSPEQCQGAKLADARSDLYSLGCILFEMIAGRPPFVSEGVGELIGMHQFVAPPSLHALVASVPAEVEAMVASLLAKAPADRPQTAASLASALDRLAQLAAPPPPPVPERVPPMAPPPAPPTEPPPAAITPHPPAPPVPVATTPAAVVVDAPARLVVLSSNFAGREFAITKTPVIVGRTDDNDIVINHPSVSRNHAQITRDTRGVYAIEDLQSANGVRVNGEDYHKVELRRGDSIDIGHVRLRFVEPGENFVFGRDAQIVDVPTGGRRKAWLWGLAGAGVLAATIGVIAAGGGGDGRGGAPVAGGSGSAGDGSAGGATSGSDTGSAVAAPGEAIDAAAAVPDLDRDAATSVAAGPGSTTMGDTAAARREAANETQFKAFMDAAAARKYEQAVVAFDKIASDSVYKNQARATYDRLHDEFVEGKVRTAKALAEQKKCAEIRVLARGAGSVFPDARTEMEKVPCEPAGTVEAGDASVGTPAAGDKTASQYADEAQAAMSAGQYGRGLSLSEAALRAPGLDASLRAKLVTMAGLSACNTQNASKAKTYYGQSPAGRQTLLRQACVKQGILLGE